MTAHILGIGTAVPDGVLDQDQALDALSRLSKAHADRRRSLSALFRRTGIHTRRSSALDALVDRPPFTAQAGDDGPSTAERMAVFAREAPPLASEAATRALDAARTAPDAITHLITVTCTGFSAPGFDVALIGELGLRPTVERTQVGYMGCHGALNALRVAKALVDADPARRVLLLAVELCSIHAAYDLAEGAIVSNSLFADGAAAAVIGAATADTALTPAWLRANGSTIFPGTEELMTWNIGDHGFRMTLSPAVPEVIAAGLVPWLHEWLAGEGLALSDVRSFAVHPGGPRILDEVERSLDLPYGGLVESRAVFRELGNMSSPTLLFILDRLLRSGAPTPIVALGFGPGLTAEAALIDAAATKRSNDLESRPT